jgi:lysophospholipase L1-like esterase
MPAGRRLALIAMTLIVVAMTACGGARENTLPAGTVVLVVGDSITAGYGVEASEAWPARLAQRTGWRVVAAGISGDRTAGGRDRLPALLEEHLPTLVIVELGGNDLLRHVPETEIAVNLDAMIDNARAHGANVVLMAAPQLTAFGALTGLSAARLYRDAAQRMKVPLIEKALPAVLSDPSLKLDALHPTPEGHRVLAERAFDELAAIGFVTKR